MTLALALLLSTICFPVMAATVPDFNIKVIIHWALVLIAVGIIFGGLLFLVRKAPFIPAEFKAVIEYILWALLIIAGIYFLLTLI
jgi:hypothetical protein